MNSLNNIKAMKLLSFVVPSYNAEKYLNKVIPSLLEGGDDVEIFIVNDGSKDNTLEIAKKFEKESPNIVKVIDKENGGHGSTINAALKEATGLYFKCIDADDWVDKDSLLKLLAKIKEHVNKNTLPDLYLVNFVYENIETGRKAPMSLRKYFPKDESIVTWENIKVFNYEDYLMMHELVYKTSVLRETNLHLPEHTFYVDNVYVYEPLYYTKTLCFLDLDFYRYAVGRADQSVSLKNMDKNYLHQLRVLQETMLRFSMEDLNKLSKKHRRQMIHSFVTIFSLTQRFCTLGDYKKKYNDYLKVIDEFKEKNKAFYKQITHKTAFAFYMILPFKLKVLMVNSISRRINKKTSWN